MPVRSRLLKPWGLWKNPVIARRHHGCCTPAWPEKRCPAGSGVRRTELVPSCHREGHEPWDETPPYGGVIVAPGLRGRPADPVNPATGSYSCEPAEAELVLLEG